MESFTNCLILSQYCCQSPCPPACRGADEAAASDNTLPQARRLAGCCLLQFPALVRVQPEVWQRIKCLSAPAGQIYPLAPPFTHAAFEAYLQCRNLFPQPREGRQIYPPKLVKDFTCLSVFSSGSLILTVNYTIAGYVPYE